MSDILSTINSFGNQRMEDIGILSFIFTVAFAIVTSFIFSWLYNRFFSRRATGSQINRAFPLLSMSITVIFITVQFSLPLSLGLLGALSIVRFRTPIKEPEEIGFIMLVVSASLSCATLNFIFPVLLVFMSWLALYLSEKFSLLGMKKLDGGMVTITASCKKDPQEFTLIEQELKSFLPGIELQSMSKKEKITGVFVFHGVSNDNTANSLSDLFLRHPDFEFNLIINNKSFF